jgi:GNAT superfamily N-acetyltransferase
VAPELAELQDRAQRREYSAAPGSAGEHVVVVDGVAVGRVWWADELGERLILDVALLPESRGQGIGSQIVAQLVESAGARPVRLAVEHHNAGWRAHLERRGFVAVGSDAARTTLVRAAEEEPGPAAATEG